ncbi:zinc finger protein OZF-like [Topomyia yanbarensis]|uniref:zinc finger protein OZF-like n=1 Tax=Topomyia yanbarensis TaxID=2498891 RepID=UPI00273B78A9|nr:zinc finger protein OZF-like [Topomyia yanbarensis]
MRICRICIEVISNNDWLSIFEGCDSVADMIQDLSGLEVTKDPRLPEFVCSLCFGNLRSALDVKYKCLESDQKLRNLLEKNLGTTEKENTFSPIISYKIIYGDVSESLLPEIETADHLVVLNDDINEQLIKIPNDPIKLIEQTEDYDCTTLSCCGCATVFESKDHLLKHSKDVHEQHRTINEERPFECEICYKRYTSKRGLNLHKGNPYQSKQYQCSVCGKRFSNLMVLANHERSHLKLKPFECVVCSKRFGTQSNLLAHLKLHSVVPEHTKHVCNYCGKGFSRKSYLKHHYSLLHSEDTPFACTFCSSKFKAKANLRLHLRTHTQERPYSCELCDRAFMYPTDRKRHMIQHTGQKPFKCADCDKAFTRKGLLQKHRVCHEDASTSNDEARLQSNSICS